MDCSIDAASPQERFVRCVDNAVDLELCDIEADGRDDVIQ